MVIVLGAPNKPDIRVSSTGRRYKKGYFEVFAYNGSGREWNFRVGFLLMQLKMAVLLRVLRFQTRYSEGFFDDNAPISFYAPGTETYRQPGPVFRVALVDDLGAYSPLLKSPELLTRYVVRDWNTYEAGGELRIICNGLVPNYEWNRLTGTAEEFFIEGDLTFFRRLALLQGQGSSDLVYESADPDLISTPTDQRKSIISL